MKLWGLFFLLIFSVACQDDNSRPEVYYITPAITEITANYSGIQKRIAISSNCNWEISDIPQWCTAQKTIEGNNEYLRVNVLSNDVNIPRDATILLSFGKISSSIHIFQDKKNESELLQWYTFPVNFFTDVNFELLADNNTRKYQILGEEVFITPSWRNQVFTGNMINRHVDNIAGIKDYFNDYSFNPITISSKNGNSRELLAPSLEGMSDFAQEIIADLPNQNIQFQLSSPVQYSSYRQLHLLGLGNIGLHLDEIVSGKSYLEQEMSKQTGMIYSYSQKMFDITMDYPQKLINEAIGNEKLSDLVYINNVTYGKTAFLLVESNNPFISVKSIIGKIAKGMNLSDEELQIANDLDIWYIYFDSNGVQTSKGNFELVNNYINDCTNSFSNGIVPLCFTINKFEDNSIGNIDIGFELP